MVDFRPRPSAINVKPYQTMGKIASIVELDSPIAGFVIETSSDSPNSDRSVAACSPSEAARFRIVDQQLAEPLRRDRHSPSRNAKGRGTAAARSASALRH